VWSECVAAIGDLELPTHHTGWTLTARYAQHVSSMLQEVIATGTHLHLCLDECPSGEGQEMCRQGHPEGQPRASAEERPSGDAHQGAE
jgi:hypothetical protein